MEAKQEQQVKDYIDKKEAQWKPSLIETVADLADLETETKEWIFWWWLKNDKDLLNYAELFNKKEDLNLWENIQFKLLEVKLSITCPYFADFKDFLAELQRWPDTSSQDNSAPENPTRDSNNNTHKPSNEATESKETWKHMFCGIDIKRIHSEPFQKNSRTWITRCSKTARENWLHFWINLPTWNAYDAWQTPWRDTIQTLPSNKTNKQPSKSREWISLSSFKSIKRWNYADIYTNSKSNYGHRAAAFKDDSGQRYVLDPYTRVNWRLDNTPKKLEDYMKEKRIVKAHIYNSTWYRGNI